MLREAGIELSDALGPVLGWGAGGELNWGVGGVIGMDEGPRFR